VTANYPTLTLAKYFSSHNLPERFVIIRHDVDRKLMNSLRTARIEHELGIMSTYYFRMNDNVFRPEIIQEIEDMGHEVGYHYEVLGKAKGNYEKAIKLFEYELSEFRKICDIRTISMHGNPLSRYDDRELWKTYNFKNFGILGEAYLSVGNGINYFSDTGRWNSRNNMRDLMRHLMPEKSKKPVNSTDDLIDLIKNNKINNLYISTHPERWASGNMEWCFNYLTDLIFNVGKKVLTVVR
jgi:hypothetical protein